MSVRSNALLKAERLADFNDNIDFGTDDATGLAQVEGLLAQRLKDSGASVEIVAAPPAAGKMVIGSLQGTGARNIP